MSLNLRYVWASVRLLLVFTVVLGFAYPLVVFAVGQLAFHSAANGSMVTYQSKTVGSSLIGQSFDGPEWFQSRPSAAGDGYDAMASGASNLSPSSAKLLALVQERKAAVAASDGVAAGSVPADALTASGSGLDPNISPEYAAEQVARVAKARGVDRSTVVALVHKHTVGRSLGFLGEPAVNVLELNLDLASTRP